ncbi:MAG: ABC transporter ATP-binding protein [Gammaproteobacteria bacterium]
MNTEAGVCAHEEVVLRLRGVSKRFGSLVANDDISIELRAGEVLALLGENGAGKSTLTSIVFGEYVADSGHVEAFGDVLPAGSPRAAIEAGIGMVHQHFALAENLSVLENVLLGVVALTRPSMQRTRRREQLERLARRFGLRVDSRARVADLSVGERQRVEILKALYRDARVLILDEPTAVLTPAESKSLFATLRQLAQDGLAIILISHKLDEVMRVSDRIVVLRAGRVVAQRYPAATSREELAELMVGARVRGPQRDPIERGACVLKLDGISVRARSRVESSVALDRIFLALHEREIVAVAGVSGNGQGLLADVLGGSCAPDAGTVELFGELFGVAARPASTRRFVELGVGRIPEDRNHIGVIGDLRIWENAILERAREAPFVRLGWLRSGAARAYARRLIDEFGIHCPGPDARTASMSGGNVQKLILARMFAHSPKLIVANQPTRGLDVGAAAFVHQRLLAARSAGAAVLLITEDLDEAFAIADMITVIHAGRLTRAQPAQELSEREIGMMMTGGREPKLEHTAVAT